MIEANERFGRKTMKGSTMKFGAHIFKLALAGAIACVEVAPLHAAETWSPLTLKPMRAVSLNEGGKHIVTYFIDAGGVCKLTMMIGESWESYSDEPPLAKPSRVTVEVASGQSAMVDTADGKALNFHCENRASLMTATEIDRVAFRTTP
ncbi:hypothetical protein [Methylocystis heyeri]|uniref:Uncharacterized protein n=1 Tax=Methylocystis heyeri TaxID=391905 RepID=A0A6B8KHE6_9HYPH|nr:hypothetical protein [Methylocystis heyeri]QGM45923.1 hypothetical protein H2LOC_009530 [Methylocystis heyeri]